MRFHCLFEQSGTFKNVLKKHGHEAFDYDILNDYGQTDHQIDLFSEILKAWKKLVNGRTLERYNSIFDSMRPGDDFVLAFFPCTYFSSLNELIFQGFRSPGKCFNKTQNDIKYIIKREYKRASYFDYFLKFCYLMETLKIPTIIENPYCVGGRNYLNLYSPYRPSWIENNRSLFGDDKVKPTMFFSLNFEMKEEFMFFEQSVKPIKKVQSCSQRARSEITSLYAENFYKRFIRGACK